MSEPEICIAPAGCKETPRTLAPFCRRHWYRIPVPIRKDIERLYNILGTGASIAIRDDYFVMIAKAKDALAASMIGKHEIAKCGNKNRKGCGKPIIWLTTRRGKRIPVEPESVEPDDQLFDNDKHIKHWIACDYAEWFRESPPAASYQDK